MKTSTSVLENQNTLLEGVPLDLNTDLCVLLILLSYTEIFGSVCVIKASAHVTAVVTHRSSDYTKLQLTATTAPTTSLGLTWECSHTGLMSVVRATKPAVDLLFLLFADFKSIKPN